MVDNYLYKLFILCFMMAVSGLQSLPSRDGSAVF